MLWERNHSAFTSTALSLLNEKSNSFPERLAVDSRQRTQTAKVCCCVRASYSPRPALRSLLWGHCFYDVQSILGQERFINLGFKWKNLMSNCSNFQTYNTASPLLIHTCKSRSAEMQICPLRQRERAKSRAKTPAWWLFCSWPWSVEIRQLMNGNYERIGLSAQDAFAQLNMR